MKNVMLLFGLLALMPFTLFSQASTNHIQNEGVDQGPYFGDWVVTIRWKVNVNQVRKINNAGEIELKYTSHYNAHWEYYNTVTGERKVGPENQNVTGVYAIGPDYWYNDRHWVYHYVNDPVFGAYHINFNLLWEFNPDTGFMEIMDIQNEWVRNP